MKCWICGNKATTGEHNIKASDLRDLFGSVTQKQPIFLHTNDKRNQKIPGVNSKILKSSALICAHCNNARTAPYDKAWQKFSRFLREEHPKLKKGDAISVANIFSNSISRHMLNVHLFFVKLFGCRIMESKIPIDIKPFSKAILEQKAHPKVFLAFGPSSNMITGQTEVEAANINDRCAFAIWFYIVEPIAVRVMYAEPSEKRDGLVNAWHPSNTSKYIIYCNHY